MRANNTLLLTKIQTAQGAVADMSSGTSVIRCQTMETQPVNTKTVEINKIAPYMGSGEMVVVNDNSTFKASVALTTGGSGVIPIGGTAPQFDTLLRAAGMAKTTSAAVTNTSQTGGSTSTIKLHSGASAVDDFYQGHAITVTETGGIAAANESVKTQITLAAVADIGTTSTTNDYYNGYDVTVAHFTGALLAASHSTIKIMLPKAVVGTSSLHGLDLTVTHSGTTETRRILTWDNTASTNLNVKVTIDTGFSFTPAEGDTFSVSEKNVITDYVGGTKVATLKTPLKYLVSNAAIYNIGATRIITDYVGSTKIATVDVDFPADTNLLGFTISAFCRYDPKSTGFEYLTADYYVDGVLHRYYDAQMNMSVAMKAADIGMINFDATGLLDTYTDAANPSATFSNNVRPLPINAANTQVTFCGYQAIASDVSIDKANAIVHRDLMGLAKIDITDYKPTGSITFEATTPSQKNFVDYIRTNASGNLVIQHGPVGNMVVITAPSVTLTDPSYSEQDGIAFWTFKLNLNPQGSGNNQFSLIFQ